MALLAGAFTNYDGLNVGFGAFFTSVYTLSHADVEGFRSGRAQCRAIVLSDFKRDAQRASHARVLITRPVIRTEIKFCSIW